MDHAGADADLMTLLSQRARTAGFLPTAAFTLGGPQDCRVPDGGVHRERSSAVYVDTAAAVVAILGPGDETFAKLPFFEAHGVEESGRSDLLDVTAETLTDEIDWP